MIKSSLYAAQARAIGGRMGRAHTHDGRLSVELSTPKAMGGDDGAGTNPEQLFAVGYAACFIGAIKAVARGEKIAVPDDLTIDSTVHFGHHVKGHGFSIAVEMVVNLPGLDQQVAEALVEKAHQVCPYSNATRGNIEVKFDVTTEPAESAAAE